MRDDIADEIGVARNTEIKAPAPVDPGLPHVLSLMVFLGVQRRMIEVVKKEPQFVLEGALNGDWSIFQGFDCMIGENDSYL